MTTTQSIVIDFIHGVGYLCPCQFDGALSFDRRSNSLCICITTTREWLKTLAHFVKTKFEWFDGLST